MVKDRVSPKAVVSVDPVEQGGAEFRHAVTVEHLDADEREHDAREGRLHERGVLAAPARTAVISLSRKLASRKS